MKNITKRISRKNLNLDSTLPLTISAQYGLVDQRKFFDKQIASKKLENYLLLKNGEFAYNKSYSKDYPFGAIKRLNNYKLGVLSTLYIAFKPVSINTDYLEEYFDSTKWYKEIYKRATEGARNHGLLNISPQDFFELNLRIPNNRIEQERISKILKLLSLLITLQQRKLKQLKLLKKAMLQTLFTNKSVPQLRFKGFTDDWEKDELGNIGRTQSGVGFPDNEQGGEKGVPFFKISDMSNTNNEFKMIYSNNYVTKSQIVRKKWKPITQVPAVIFAKVGAALMLNRKRLVCVPFLIDNNTMAYIFGKKWEPYFGKFLFDTLNLPKFAQTGALPSFNASNIETIKILLPQKREQQTISSFLLKVNDAILYHQHKLDHLKKIKQFLLQNMFI